MNFKNINIKNISGWSLEQLQDLQDQLDSVQFDDIEESLEIFDVKIGAPNGKVR